MQKSENYKKNLLLKVNPSDLDEICEIEKGCYQNPWNYNSFENELSQPFSYNYKFLVDQKIIGYCFCSLCFDNLQINNFCIDIHNQNKGYGFLFLNLLITEAKKYDVKVITLEVDIKNFKAIQLYEKQGFKKDRTIRKFYSNGNDAVKMLLFLK